MPIPRSLATSSPESDDEPSEEEVVALAGAGVEPFAHALGRSGGGGCLAVLLAVALSCLTCRYTLGSRRRGGE